MKNYLSRQSRFRMISSMFIVILTITFWLPSALSAAVNFLYYSENDDPGIGIYTSSGANDSSNHLYSVGFTVSVESAQDPVHSSIYKVNRNDSATPWTNWVWRKTIKLDPDLTVARDVTTDRRNDVLVVGETEGRGGLDAFLRKYRKDGHRLWTRRFHRRKDSGYGTAVDSARNVYMVGGIAAADTAAGSADDQGFIIKFNESGRKLWGKRFGSAGNDAATAVAVDRKRNVYVAGITDGAMGRRFGDIDVFLRKYSRTGKHLWTRQFGTPKQERGVRVAIDGYGKIYVAGVTKGTFRGFRRRSGQKFFLRKYSIKGNGLWTRQFGRAAVVDSLVGSRRVSSGRRTSLAIDSLNNVYVSGTTPRGRIHVQKFSRRGRSRWGRDPVSALSTDLTVDNSNLYIFGDNTDIKVFVAKTGK